MLGEIIHLMLGSGNNLAFLVKFVLGYRSLCITEVLSITSIFGGNRNLIAKFRKGFGIVPKLVVWYRSIALLKGRPGSDFWLLPTRPAQALSYGMVWLRCAV